MKKITYRITDPQGIHARPAAILVKRMLEFNSKIMIEKNGKTVNGKEILTLMSLAVQQGDLITITFEGEDERAAMEAAVKYLRENL